MNDILQELRTALYSVWHRRWIAIAVAWAVCLLGWLAVSTIPNSYESKARIYVDVDDVLSEQLGIAGDGREEIMRVRQTLVSTKNLKRVISSTKLGDGITGTAQMDAAVAELAERVQVTSQQDNLFEIIATVGKDDLSDAENAVLARNVVQKLLDIFREEHISGNRAEINKAIDELDDQLEERKLELETAEQRRLTFEAQYPELIGGSATLSTKIQQARTELRDIDADLAAASSALAAIRGQLASTPRMIAGTGPAGGPRGALMQVQGQLAELRSRGLKDEHPDIVSTTRQIRLLEQQVALAGPDNAGGTPNPAYSSLLAIRADREAGVESLMARRAALQSQVASLMASQASSPEVAAEANRISRDYEVLRKNYEDRLQDREEIRTRGNVVDQTSQYKFDLIDPPVVPQKPAAPNRPLLLLGVLVLGLGGGAGVAYAIGQVKSSFATPQGLEKAFDLPVIGTISLTLSDAVRALERRRLKQFVAACGGLGAMFVVLLVIEIVSVGSVA
jgi:polysaccharide chain length determinant protein (PEP-CTERM system associated)